MASQMNQGPPYLPTVWSLGGRPVKHIDIPITAVFLALYLTGAATHMTIFQRNNKRGHKFIFSAVMFGFCMARSVTCILRIASVSLPTNIRLAIAAAIFLNAAVLLIFIINLLWAQRILRALHPKVGWHRITSTIFLSLYVVIVLTLAVLITAVVQSFYTLRPRTKTIDRSLQLYGLTLFAIISILPLFIVPIALLAPRSTQAEKFGHGRLRTKVTILLIGSTLLGAGAWYRCGTQWVTPVPQSKPLPAYFAKPCLYIFYFGVEILTIYMYALMRVDLRMHVPNGSKGSYEAHTMQGAEDDEEKTVNTTGTFDT